MTRCQWDELPAGVHDAVQRRCGPVIEADPVADGTVSDFAATLYTDRGRVFCKGVRQSNRLAWTHRNEARINPWLADIAPRLLWEADVDGWLMLGFEFAEGHHADLSIQSPDLVLIAATLAAAEQDLTPCPPVPLQNLADRWAPVPGWSLIAREAHPDLDAWCREYLDLLIQWESLAPRLVAGQTLLHTDLTAHNLLIDGTRVHVIDWAWPCRGAAWVDVAFLVARLVHAGHHPREAENWARQMPAWNQASDDAVTSFAVALTGLWERRRRTNPAPHRDGLTAAARTWMRHRLEETPTIHRHI